MKPNKLTPGHNLVWESSRFMLPEHREALREKDKNKQRKEPPVLDEQALAEISENIKYAQAENLMVTVYMFDPFEVKYTRGRIDYVDLLQKRMKMLIDNDPDKIQWIAFDQIIDVTL